MKTRTFSASEMENYSTPLSDFFSKITNLKNAVLIFASQFHTHNILQDILAQQDWELHFNSSDEFTRNEAKDRLIERWFNQINSHEYIGELLSLSKQQEGACPETVYSDQVEFMSDIVKCGRDIIGDVIRDSDNRD
jgi:hypothetical protein